MQRLAISLGLATLASGLSAQEYTDTFSVPGTSVPGWTTQTGVWSVNTSGRLQTNGATTWSYLTLNNYTALNCVLDMEAFYSASGVQFAGLTARYASTSSTIMCKIQENTATTQDFDRAFIYEQGGSGSVWADTTTKVTGSAICRLIVCGNNAWMKMDFDKDGTFDQTVGPRSLSSVTGAGLIGVNMYSISQIDNFKFFNAVLKPAASATPKIGTTFNMELYTTSTTLIPWRMALSLGNTGFPLGSRRIPLDPDPVFDLSLQFTGALGLAGVTDTSGFGKPGLIIPNSAVLVGQTVFAAAITIDGAKPMSIDNISNDIAIKFVQ